MPNVLDTIGFVLLVLCILGGAVYLFVLICKALKKFLSDSGVKPEKGSQKANVKIPLGEAIKGHRIRCEMTQEFVAEALGVSRQTVSKWESGISTPSTSNLLKLANLFGIPPEELLCGKR